MSEDLVPAVDPFATPDVVAPEIQIDEPINLRPDLSLYGIDETDRGVCEDTYENRSALRRARMNWIPLYAVNGVPTGLIQALSPEMQSRQRLLSLEEKKQILTDVDDKNSDYLTGYDLLAEEAADYIVPPWVLGATRTWSKQQMETNGDPVGHGKKVAHLPTRCKAIKDDGIRCQLWSGGRAGDDGFCRVHLGALRNKPTDSVERARARLTQSAPAAVDTLEELMNSAESEPVKLKAATEILDRSGVRAGFDIGGEVSIDVRPAASIIAERLQRLAINAMDAEQRFQQTVEQTESSIIDVEATDANDTETEEVDKSDS